jgi:hypothetical protein
LEPGLDYRLDTGLDSLLDFVLFSLQFLLFLKNKVAEMRSYIDKIKIKISKSKTQLTSKAKTKTKTLFITHN